MPSFITVGGDARLRRLRAVLSARGFTDRTIEAQHEQGTADLLILPVPSFGAAGKVSGTSDRTADDLLGAGLPPLVVGGMLPPTFVRSCENRGVKAVDLTVRNDFAVLNAVPTAEAAVMIALEELPVTLWRTETLVLGYGRIAQLLSERLLALGARVTVAARDAGARAYAVSRGMRAVDIGDPIAVDPGRYRLVFNTVPARVIDRAFAVRLADDSLTVDLASMPGGCDAEAMAALGKKRIHALSLPGRSAPETAGDVMAAVTLAVWEETNGRRAPSEKEMR